MPLQGRVEVGDITCIVDILERNSPGTFNVYEIKGTSSAKTEHECDLAFQVYLLEQAGYTIEKVGVVHADKTYLRSGDIDVDKLTVSTDITEAVRKRVGLIATDIEAALDIIKQPTPPDFSPIYAGKGAFSEWLAILKTLQVEPFPENHIYQIAGLGIQRAKKLEAAGIEFIEDIPASISFTEKQRKQIKVILEKNPNIDKEAIRSFLSSFTYPIYFLDYETFSHVIPPIDGVWPYQQVSFQYSLHRLDEDGKLTHYEYLHREASNPVPSLTASLQANLGNAGTVLVWYESFEKGRNVEMGKMLPESNEFYTALNARVIDLMHPFSKGMYVDAAFKGSASIKKVLPVIVPALSYNDLEIQDGSSAQQSWMKTVFNDGTFDNKIFDDLITYCTLDTYAMVEIHRALLAI